MKSKSLILSIIFGLILVSCDSTILIKVGLSGELSNQNISLVDYDFIVANSNNSDKIFFEFITDQELDQSTVITFLDKADNILATKEVGPASNLISNSSEINGERSFAYSINLDNLRSTSLIHEVIIGDQ